METRPTGLAAGPITHAAVRERFRPWPGLLVGLLLLPPTIIWIVYNETVLAGALATQMSLPLSVVLEMSVLAALNALVGRFRPRWRLSQSQLLLTYVVLAAGTAASGFWYTQALPTVAGYMVYFGTPAVPGGPTLMPGLDLSNSADALPGWFIMKDRAALQVFYEGANETTSAAAYWRAWFAPMSFWVLYFAVFVTVVLCLSVLLRRQWADRERLNFPLTQVPLAITNPGAPIYKNRLLWLGLLLAGSVDALNNLAMIYPNVPSLAIGYRDLASTLRAWGFPFSQMTWGAFGLSFYPFVIGLGFLMPLDMLFSFWFFYLFWNVVRLLVAGLGFPYPGIGAEAMFPYIPDQVQGGYLALGVMALWASRKDFRYALRQLLRREPPDREHQEAVSYPRALVGAVLGSLALIVMLTAAGCPWPVSAAFVVGFLIISVSIARLRAEFGAPFHDVEYNTPDFVLPKILGSSLLGPRALGVLSMQIWYSAENFTHPMPHAIEALRLGSVSPSRTQRPFFWAVLLAWVVGMVLCLVVMLHFSYELGYTSAKMLGQRNEWYGENFARLNNLLSTPTFGRVQSGIGVLVGLLSCVGLQALRLQFPGFPLDPVAYSLASTATASSYWFPLFISWVLKSLILRYGGRRGYAAALPFFLGLVIGEAFVGAGWSIVGCLLGRSTYRYYYF